MPCLDNQDIVTLVVQCFWLITLKRRQSTEVRVEQPATNRCFIARITVMVLSVSHALRCEAMVVNLVSAATATPASPPLAPLNCVH